MPRIGAPNPWRLIMLDANLKGQLKAYMANITQPIELVASLDDGAKSRELKTLLDEIAELSDKVTIAAGHDNVFYNNRVISSGRLADGRLISAQNVGLYIWDSYKSGSTRFCLRWRSNLRN